MRLKLKKGVGVYIYLFYFIWQPNGAHKLVYGIKLLWLSIFFCNPVSKQKIPFLPFATIYKIKWQLPLYCHTFVKDIKRRKKDFCILHHLRIIHTFERLAMQITLMPSPLNFACDYGAASLFANCSCCCRMCGMPFMAQQPTQLALPSRDNICV